MNNYRIFYILFLAVFYFLCFPQYVLGYLSGVSASLVLGQSAFNGSGPNSTKQGLNGPTGVANDGVHLVVADSLNNRILLYNSIPLVSSTLPDFAIGQQDFTSSQANQGGSVAGNTLNYPTQMDFAGGSLLVADLGNNRVLIFSSLPQKNNTSADIVIGQSDMGSSVSGLSATQLNQPNSVAFDSVSGKIAIADTGNNRILIYNKIPIANNQAADVVLGQTSFATSSADVRQDALSNPYSVKFINGKLVAADTGNNRVLIWNSIPTTNGQPADIVVGQANFTSNSANQGGSAGANTLSSPIDTTYDGTRFVIGDQGNNRLLIFNNFPYSNNPTADQVLGQTGFTNTSVNAGGNTSGFSLNNPSGGLASVGRSLLVGDTGNNRVLFFYNYSSTTSMSLTNNALPQPSSQLRMYGNITLNNYYKVQGVQFQVNSGAWQSGAAVDGSFDEIKEDFYLNYDPNSNKQGEGYTIRVKATNTNNDLLDNLFYFEPFRVNGPSDFYITNDYYPSFDFSVNKQLQAMSGNLSNYQIWIKRPGTGNWKVYLSGIPIDFNLVRLNSENLKRANYTSQTHNGVYETSTLSVTYSEESSRITVRGKSSQWLTGTYQWKVVAVDKAGHTQEIGQRTITNNTKSNITNNQYFPLEVLSISGVESAGLSTSNPRRIKSLYTSNVQDPVIYGIAPRNALISLHIIDLLCRQHNEQNCVQNMTTIADSNSRFGINLPKNLLKRGRIYALSLSDALENNYNELPLIYLKINKISQNIPKEQVIKNNKLVSKENITPLLKNQNTQTKHSFCILIFCL